MKIISFIKNFKTVNYKTTTAMRYAKVKSIQEHSSKNIWGNYATENPNLELYLSIFYHYVIA